MQPTNETKENILYASYNMLIVGNILKMLLFETKFNHTQIHTTESLLHLIASTKFSVSTLSSTQPSEKSFVSPELTIAQYLDTKSEDPTYPLYKTNITSASGNSETVYAVRPELLSTMKRYQDVKTLLTSVETSPFFKTDVLQTHENLNATQNDEMYAISKEQYLFFLKQRKFINALFKKLTPGFETESIVTSSRSK